MGDRRAQHDHRQPRSTRRRQCGVSALTPGRSAQTGGGSRLRRWADGRAACRARPEANGELPVAVLAEEIETDGPGQIRALITIGGNPILSTPDSDRLDRALARLEFMVSVDIYVNETTRHADVILPGAVATGEEPLRRGVLQPVAAPRRQLLAAAVHQPTSRARATSLGRLALIVRGGAGPDADPRDRRRTRRRCAGSGRQGSRTATCSVAMSTSCVSMRQRRHRTRIGWSMRCVRTGPWGDGFGVDAERADVADVDRQPARHRLRSARAAAARATCARRRARSSWRRVSIIAALAGFAGHGDCIRCRRRPAPHRSPSAAVQQQLDAQHQGPREGQGSLHAADASRRCRRPRSHRR